MKSFWKHDRSESEEGECAHSHTAGKLPRNETYMKDETIKLKFVRRNRLKGQWEDEDANLFMW